MILAVSPAFAAEPIVPTSDPGSDCVAAKIYAKRTSLNQKYDEMYCAANTDPTAYDRCLRNVSSDKTIAFFTDRCNPPEEGAYVSFNGKTHAVQRQPGESHPDVDYAGTWSGQDVVVRVMPKKLIERYEDERVTYQVEVRITSGDSSAIIQAIYDDRP